MSGGLARNWSYQNSIGRRISAERELDRPPPERRVGEALGQRVARARLDDPELPVVDDPVLRPRPVEGHGLLVLEDLGAAPLEVGEVVWFDGVLDDQEAVLLVRGDLLGGGGRVGHGTTPSPFARVKSIPQSEQPSHRGLNGQAPAARSMLGCDR